MYCRRRGTEATRFRAVETPDRQAESPEGRMRSKPWRRYPSTNQASFHRTAFERENQTAPVSRSGLREECVAWEPALALCRYPAARTWREDSRRPEKATRMRRARAGSKPPNLA